MRISDFSFCLFLGLSCAVTAGYAQSSQNADEPLSAIDWLSDVVREVPKPITTKPKDSSQDVATSASVSTVTTTPLGQIKLDAVGLLPRASTGLPADFWKRSSASALAAQIRDMRSDLPPPLAQFLTTLLLAELPPPADSTDDALMFLARVDKFLELGALDQASALLARAGPTKPQLFGRWFDVSVLTGQDEEACRAMLANPTIAPTYPARIFCLARAGDWDAAALTLGTAKTLGVITAKEDALLARFLDPELFEGDALLPIPDRITPLTYRMHDAIGEPLSLGGLPHAFAYSEMAENNGWKSRISAAERLTRTSAIPPEKLLALYTERTPAASGGVWDRVEAVQSFEVALKARDPNAVMVRLPVAMRAMRSAGLEYAFAQAYGEILGKIPLTGESAIDAARAGLMSNGYELTANAEVLSPDVPPLWKAVATGLTDDQTSTDALEAAIIAAFTSDAAPERFTELLTERRLGEATLQAVALMADGPRSDPADIERGLALLHHIGLRDIARRTALYMLLTRPRA